MKKVILLLFFINTINATIIYYNNPTSYILNTKNNRLEYNCTGNGTLKINKKIIYSKYYPITPASCKYIVKEKIIPIIEK